MSKLKIGFSALFMLIILSMFAAIASAEGFTPTPGNPAPNIHVGTIDNDGKVNQHRTHGNFQNNTNSCANCHSTHNGDSATLLKFETTESDLCMSCHDGTLGFYNVKGYSEGAGTFNTTHESASMHNVGVATIGSAPGAFNNKLTGELQCSSCHNPHGSTNDRLLKNTVAGVTYSTTPIKLALTEDPDFANINNSSTNSGLKIYKSIGPNGNDDKTNYSNFCSTCHDSYLAKSKEKTSLGHYSHTTNTASAGRNCASCHFAHGTDITLLKDTAGRRIADYVKLGWTEANTKEYMKDVSAGGSNLKRYTNTAVCWACHQSTKRIDTPPVAGGNYNGKPTR